MGVSEFDERNDLLLVRMVGERVIHTNCSNANEICRFEAFDEPWKVIYNTDTDKWESQWGLMDSNRNVKDGLKIPSCAGKTVDRPY